MMHLLPSSRQHKTGRQQVHEVPVGRSSNVHTVIFLVTIAEQVPGIVDWTGCSEVLAVFSGALRPDT
jgi:hypothetical protein